MFRYRLTWLLFAPALTLVVSRTASAQEQSDVAIAKIGKAASALLTSETTTAKPPRAPGGFGVGFARARNATHLTPICIHPSGSFLVHYGPTNLPLNGQVQVVVNLGLKDQQNRTARVVRRDDNLKIALIQTIEPIRHPAAALADGPKWKFGGEVVTFGFPQTRQTGFGATAAVSFIVKKSLVKKTGLKDGNQGLMLKSPPGTGGGPILNREGKLTGFYGAGGEIVSIQAIRPLLTQPVVILAATPLNEKNQHKPVEFQVRIVSLNETTRVQDLSVKLTLGFEGNVRTFTMTRKDGVFRLTAVPVPPTKEKPKYPIRATFADGTMEGFAFDQTINVGKSALKLSEILQLRITKDSVNAILADRKIVTMPRDGLTTIKVNIGGEMWPVDLKQATVVTIGSPKAISRIACSVQATTNGKIICRSDENLAIASARRSPPPATSGTPLTATQKRIVDILFERYDTNRDGKVDRNDAGVNATIIRFIERMDRNNDGSVTRDEVEFYYQNRTPFAPAKGGFPGTKAGR